MRVGCLEKALPFELQKVDKGIYNLYVPGSLDLKGIKEALRNPPEDCYFLTIRDGECKDRWHNMIEHVSKEFPDLKYFRIEQDGNAIYIIDFKNIWGEE